MSSRVAGAACSSHNASAHPGSSDLFRGTPRLLPCIALGLVLFLAQAAAIVHSSTHAGSGQQQHGLHSQLCDACLSFSTIFSMAGGPGAMPVLAPVVVAFLVDAAHTAFVGRATPLAFQSRAPPRH
jgi:hypothetical protein